MDTTRYDVLLDGVSKVHGRDLHVATALRNVTLGIEPGEFVAVVGPSGSGKSTLLNLAAGIEEPSAGRVVVGGRDLAGLSDEARSDLRLREIGFVFQGFNLLPSFTVEENVAWPLEFLGFSWREARGRAGSLLELVAIPVAAHRRRPGELSGGEQQRVAIARAIVAEPRIILADEPTGNLDSSTGLAILDLLRTLNRERGVTLIMVTHNPHAAALADRTVELRDGRMIVARRGPRARTGESLAAAGA